MSLPDEQQWLFAFKTFAAAMLAMAIGLWLDLPRPYWAVATVYITSHPLSGTTRSKAVFRVIGTLIGACVAVAIVPNLAGAPPLLVLAIALWSALCIYVSVLDRSPRSYVAMLAGYTTALIGFPTVDTPNQIFDIALARTEEIVLGITCAAVVSSVVFPRSVGPLAAQRVKAWFKHAHASVRDAVSLNKSPAAEAHRLQVAADSADIENLVTFLSYDTNLDQSATRWIKQLQPRMLLLLPVMSSVADRLDELQPLGGPSAPVAALVERTRVWMEGDEPGDGAVRDALLADVQAEIDQRPHRGAWRDLLELGLLMRLRDLLNIQSDCIALAAATTGNATTLDAPLHYPIEQHVAVVKHQDHGMALLAAFVTLFTVITCCTFWIVCAWPAGGTAAMMATIGTSLFAARDDPYPSIVGLTKWTIVAAFAAAAYLLLILPAVHNFESLALVLAPAFILYGVLMGAPATYPIGLGLAVNTASLIALQEMYTFDTASFLNSTVAVVTGTGLAALVTAVLRPVGAEWSALRLINANRATLAQAADISSENQRASVAGLMIDRMMLLAPRAAAAGHTMPEALRELRAGFNILDLHRARRELRRGARRRLELLLIRLERHYASASSAPPAGLLRTLDRALAAVRDEPSATARRAVLGLVGLRRCLFPAAKPPQLAPQEAA
ncbi:FUSC family protein [Rhodopseudomonas palustris]|uniref:FUSC family protein n=1 Tax=Rhodopseudomonas palustris TaxID=1076 RepID=UPI0022F02A2F|nr:FUSC family protein [Rhodopseudomonas palustris]WBU31794.1 FUSC family protein [Rhodopseudomonas palustris]